MSEKHPYSSAEGKPLDVVALDSAMVAEKVIVRHYNVSVSKRNGTLCLKIINAHGQSVSFNHSVYL